MSSNQPPARDQLTGEELRPHVYDGIQEFDKKLPNWWLHTFYWAIAFSVVYWFVHFQSTAIAPDQARVDSEMARIEEAKMAASGDYRSDDALWGLSRSDATIEAGRLVYTQNCVPCHLANLRGKDAGGIGANLVSGNWIHGGRPSDLFKVVSDGVAAKGMPAWSSTLGDKRMAQALAYILSHHQAGANSVASPR